MTQPLFRVSDGRRVITVRADSPRHATMLAADAGKLDSAAEWLAAEACEWPTMAAEAYGLPEPAECNFRPAASVRLPSIEADRPSYRLCEKHASRVMMYG